MSTESKEPQHSWACTLIAELISNVPVRGHADTFSCSHNRYINKLSPADRKNDVKIDELNPDFTCQIYRNIDGDDQTLMMCTKCAKLLQDKTLAINKSYKIQYANKN